MEISLWDSLPQPLRAKVDDLVLHDRRFEAIRAIWESGIDPRPGLYDCQRIVAERYQALSDRIEFRPSPLVTSRL